MRRRLCGAVLGLLLGTLLAGCGPKADAEVGPTATTGATASATPFVPVVGACHPAVEKIGYRTSYATVDCAKVHRTETVHIGAFTGAAAQRVTPPAEGSAESRAAFGECDTRTSAFLGGEWRGGLFTVQVVVPEPRDWTAGARWFRCDVFVLTSLDGGSAREHPDDRDADRTGTLRGVLRRPSPLAYGCFTEDEYENLLPAACTAPHRFEYVGVWTTPYGTYAAADQDQEPVHRQCRTVIAAYTRGTPNAGLARDAGTTYRLPSEEAWQRGDRGVRCFYWSDRRDVSRSLKG